ncbi:MAG: glycosyltransferase family 2 protein [bacterium]
MRPKVSVVFVNYNSTALLESALCSLVAAEPDLPIETIVVDNASSDLAELAAVCRQYGARLLRLSRNLGIGAAVNRAARYVRSTYLAAANPDLEFEPGALSVLVRFMDERRDAGVAAPQFRYADGAIQPSARRLPRLRYVLAGRRSPLARLLPVRLRRAEFLYAGIERSVQPVAVEAVIGAFMLFRRDAFEQAGRFDEGYFMYAEDVDICRRLGMAGWRAYVVPAARVTHLVGQVRKSYRAFSEFHRLRSHRRYFLAQARGPRAAALDFLFGCYLALQSAAGLLGLSEYEYSWARAR